MREARRGPALPSASLALQFEPWKGESEAAPCLVLASGAALTLAAHVDLFHLPGAWARALPSTSYGDGQQRVVLDGRRSRDVLNRLTRSPALYCILRFLSLVVQRFSDLQTAYSETPPRAGLLPLSA